jgi:phosphopantothenate-cysteine ligase/phosphopantothenoylcysteine decarboxylase/phosphopantothenate--cysteine ligase
MRIFVTAGNTQTPIDRVRCITNIFTGRTGAAIALEAYRRGHHVTLATSHPEVVDQAQFDVARWRCLRYRTFDELAELMSQAIAHEQPDAVVHCAAVGDYELAGVFAPLPTTHFDSDNLGWYDADETPALIDRSAGKIKSDEPELWLRLVRAPKLVDKIRTEWGYRKLLVKFKLEVGVTEEALLAIAEKSRQQSAADWMVANTLEGAAEWALLGNERGYRKLTRAELAGVLIDELTAHRTL